MKSWSNTLWLSLSQQNWLFALCVYVYVYVWPSSYFCRNILSNYSKAVFFLFFSLNYRLMKNLKRISTKWIKNDGEIEHFDMWSDSVDGIWKCVYLCILTKNWINFGDMRPLVPYWNCLPLSGFFGSFVLSLFMCVCALDSNW